MRLFPVLFPRCTVHGWLFLLGCPVLPAVLWSLANGALAKGDRVAFVVLALLCALSAIWCVLVALMIAHELRRTAMLKRGQHGSW